MSEVCIDREFWKKSNTSHYSKFNASLNINKLEVCCIMAELERIQHLPFIIKNHHYQRTYHWYFLDARLAFPEENNASLKKIAKLDDPAQYSKVGLVVRLHTRLSFNKKYVEVFCLDFGVISVFCFDSLDELIWTWTSMWTTSPTLDGFWRLVVLQSSHL